MAEPGRTLAGDRGEGGCLVASMSSEPRPGAVVESALLVLPGADT